jgi:hypothetical protein
MYLAPAMFPPSIWLNQNSFILFGIWHISGFQRWVKRCIFLPHEGYFCAIIVLSSAFIQGSYYCLNFSIMTSWVAFSNIHTPFYLSLYIFNKAISFLIYCPRKRQKETGNEQVNALPGKFSRLPEHKTYITDKHVKTLRCKTIVII